MWFLERSEANLGFTPPDIYLGFLYMKTIRIYKNNEYLSIKYW